MPVIHFFVVSGLIGSACCIAGGLWATMTSSAGSPSATAGIILSVAGLVTAIGSIVVPVATLIVRGYFGDRKAERERKTQTHDFAEKLHKAHAEIDQLKAEKADLKESIRRNAERITDVESGLRDSGVFPPMPDPDPRDHNHPGRDR